MSVEHVDINSAEGHVTVQLNKKLYKQESILQAAHDFCENFWVMIYHDIPDYTTINLKPKDEYKNDVNLTELGLEFFNYTLGLMQH